MSIADSPLDLNSLSLENETLKERIAKLEHSSGVFDEKAIQAMIEARVSEILKDKS